MTINMSRNIVRNLIVNVNHGEISFIKLQEHASLSVYDAKSSIPFL